MAAKKEAPKPAPGEQLDLIDVAPDNLKEIKPVAERYRQAVRARGAATAEETAAKHDLLSLIKDAALSRLADGSIKFKCDGLLISVTPRDELIRVREEKGEDEDED